MKKTIILFFTYIFLANILAAQTDNIYVEVDGNNATIWQTNAERNCCALYRMDVEMENNEILWYQIDTGDVCWCICHFDLSVTIGPLEQGEYNVDVFATEITYPDDTTFQGSTSFTIGEGNFKDNVNIISQYQSECYNYIKIKDPDTNQDELLLQNFPNPFNNKTTIMYSVNTSENIELIIYNCVGQIVRKFNCNNLINGTIEWDGTNKLGKRVGPGLYFYSLSSPEFRITKKMQITE
ncbi:MAG: T9SS type A sorting domain-containing protein [Bacteroidales bacterium]|nr:T9SS type A sorting domain-containing protein [Bacteroidales bacterium]